MTGIHLVLVTHSGKFHCDEVFAYVVLRLALALGDGDHTLIRTRDPAVIAGADWAWDVGSVYDLAARRFDHHQRGAPTRPDGTPFSSAGLVWQAMGGRAVAALLGDGSEQFAAAIAADLDATLVRHIDEADNGVASMRARHAADAMILAAHAASADPRVLELSRGMPWQAAVFAHDLPVLYAVYPVSNGNWMVDSMPPEPGSFAQRLPLPESWAGLQDAVLAAETGVPDAVFVHLRRFIAAARTRDGALALAGKAIAAG